MGIELFKGKFSGNSFDKIKELGNLKLEEFIAQFVELCNPGTIYVCDDSDNDYNYIRNKSVEKNEEHPLAIDGHTVHFDGPNDQARDKANTKYLLPKGRELKGLNSINKEEGVKEVYSFLKDSMAGKEMYILFFCLGPVNSEFSISAVQITDSTYVAHSEYILYRRGYEQFKRLKPGELFFRFVHTAGELENGMSKNIDKRRVYIDLDENIVYSTNTQYAGNTVGLKKLALRLAIQKAAKDENWLAEHMFLAGINGPNGRKTYFTGAFPSACGKTSTAMLPGESIVGDDIAYLRKRAGKIFAANVECGIFGIIGDVNAEDAPVIWEVLTSPGEVIFSNVLVTENNEPRWLGDKRPVPKKGINYAGEWYPGKKDEDGNEIKYAHKNARYTVGIERLENADTNLNNPDGLPVSGVIYGGRDSSVWPPVQEAFGWEHGIITMGASLESETTAATLGAQGVRQINPMSNLDFLSIPLSAYIENNINFVNGLDNMPKIFAVNYFQKDENGGYITGMDDKRVWVKWMELRVHRDVDAIETPTGHIPYYEDLKKLFSEVLGKDYSKEDYDKQFTFKSQANLDKIERIKAYYKEKAPDIDGKFFEVLDEQKVRIIEAKNKYGDVIAPDSWTDAS